jgi:light-regulated signal transduction histidine kinase (bacteriophytochrome)
MWAESAGAENTLNKNNMQHVSNNVGFFAVQVDASVMRSYGGSGLGLVISKSLAEAMGGRMWAESAGAENTLNKNNMQHVSNNVFLLCRWMRQ